MADIYLTKKKKKSFFGPSQLSSGEDISLENLKL